MSEQDEREKAMLDLGLGAMVEEAKAVVEGKSIPPAHAYVESDGEVFPMNRIETRTHGELMDSMQPFLEGCIGFEMEVVFDGALRKFAFNGSADPRLVKGALLTLDPGAKFREDFPRSGGGGGGWGPKELKTARVRTLTACFGTFNKVTFLAREAGEGKKSFEVMVMKEAALEVVGAVVATGGVPEDMCGELLAAKEGGGNVVLDELMMHQLGVQYEVGKDGKVWFKGVLAMGKGV